MNNPEADLAKHVIKHFESIGYITYKEVSLGGGGTIRADVYCKGNGESIAIEIKMSMCLKVIEQGFRWREHSNKVYIVISKKGKPNLFSEQICRDYGIGLLQYRNGSFIERVSPFLNKTPIEPTLYKEQLLSDASNNRGDFVTPFKLTKIRLIDYVGDDKVKLSVAIQNIEHHYKNDTSAMSSLKSMIKIGVIELDMVKEGKDYWVSKSSSKSITT